jgi:hypothetical protein
VVKVRYSAKGIAIRTYNSGLIKRVRDAIREHEIKEGCGRGR